MRKWVEALEERVLAGERLNEEEALRLVHVEGRDIYELFPSAHRLARATKGWEVELCGIANAKSGRCPEDCAFCAQSAHHCTDAPVYGLKASDDLLEQARVASGIRANRFGLITSGTGINGGWELDRICETVSAMAAEGKVSPCASLGILSEETLLRLKAAGMRGYHHNLETARSFFPQICTTHDYEEDVATVAAAKKHGLMTCSGGIFGLGESPAQRVELAFTLRELDVDSVPLNFLVPVAGTRLETMPPLEPLECLKIIALYRFVLPQATIKVCAGRDRNLRDLASWIFYAGANGMMIGNYLTTAGRDPDLDLAMLRALGLTPIAEA